MKKSSILLIISIIALIIVSVIIGIMISFDNKLEKGIDKDNELLLTCESESIKIDKNLVCRLSGKSSTYDVSAVSAKIENSNNFSITSLDIDFSWEGDGDDNFIALYTDENKKNNFPIATFTINLINDNVDEISINIIENSFSDEYYEEHKLDDIVKVLKVDR